MEKFFGLDIGDHTFGHQKNNCVIDVHDLFNDDSDEESLNTGSNHINNIQFFSLGSDRMLLILKHPACLYFRGTLSVSCLGGSVELDGHIMNSNESTSLDVYSPCSHSALCFSTIDAEFNNKEELETLLKSLHALYLFEQLYDETPISCLLLLRRNKLHGFNKLSFEMKQALFPNMRSYGGIIHFRQAEEFLNCVFDLPSGDRIKQKTKHNELFRNAAKELLTHTAPRLAVCGEKGVGKSTALRFLVNQLLSVGQNILFIDFDIGQPEFTVPGCVSIVLVSIPLLGPSYSHITTPLRSIFLGFVNADLCLDDYREAVKEFEDFCLATPDFSSIPWVINTMGYVKGCGLILLNDIISRFKLTHCFQLNNNFNKSNKKNLPLISQIDDGFHSKYILKSFQMFHPPRTTSNITPRACRELMVTFYFNCHKFFLNVQKIKMNCDINSSYENAVIFESLIQNNNSLMRGEVVAVCVPILESFSFTVPYLKRCIGFGLVVSNCDNEFKVLTPVHESIFEEFCYIVRGDLELNHAFAEDILSNNNLHAQDKSCITLTDGSDALCQALFSFIS